MQKNKNDDKKIEEMKKKYENVKMSEKQIDDLKKTIHAAKSENKTEHKKYAGKRSMMAAAAAVAIFLVLPNTSREVAYAMGNIPVFGKLVEIVTFRDYQYEDERNNANISVPELVVGETEGTETTEQEVQETLKKTTEEINAEIQTITEQMVAEFEENLKGEEGYQDMVVTHEILNTTEDYFTLKLICYQGAGSGAEWDYFYSIDLATGKRIALSDLFKDGADYTTAISENIKEQMKAQMAEDEMVAYWVDNTEVPEWDFKTITDETSFYLNENGNVVICFDEGEVAPMYMGCVEFEIPEEVVADLRK